MRLALLVVGGLTAGGWAVGATHGIFPMPDQMRQAITAMGGDPAKLKTIDVNPVKAYNDVMRQITSGQSGPPADFHPTAVIVPRASMIGTVPPDFTAGPRMPNGFAPGMASQIQQNTRRMEEIAASARNPAAWRGTPPR